MTSHPSTTDRDRVHAPGPGPGAGPLALLRTQPRWFATLFWVDMWERFSFYGLAAILYLYATAPVALGGLGWTQGRASATYGGYLALVFLAALPGGWVADRWLGPRRATLLGGVVIAAGHLVLAIPADGLLYAGLALVVIGSGLVKPAIATMVTEQRRTDQHREAALSVFYMSVQLSALAAPLVVGFLGQRVQWHLGFGAAAAGMAVGLVVYVRGLPRFGPVGDRVPRVPRDAGPVRRPGRRRQLTAFVLVMLASSLFWAVYGQGHTLLTDLAEHRVDATVAGFDVPASWFLAVEPLGILLLAPWAGALWLRLGPRVVSPHKIGLGLVGMAAAWFVLLPITDAEGPAAAGWLVASYLLQAAAQLLVAPVGLALAVAVAGPGQQNRFIGVFWVFAALGAAGGGQLGRLPAHTGLSAYVLGAVLVLGTAGLLLTLAGRTLQSRLAGAPVPAHRLTATPLTHPAEEIRR